ncbi:hypothetical protein F7725_025893 [Dissostichus mawsoni]|uniref:Ig-like domain-containing protein n=1 Tax=Dissostichus mawsoni TaxID=36200 RepID=A0A7J5X6Z9_DISMA|nr:hypothetical protein F7725_025893 [Dissostichus mawsoni]
MWLTLSPAVEPAVSAGVRVTVAGRRDLMLQLLIWFLSLRSSQSSWSCSERHDGISSTDSGGSTMRLRLKGGPPEPCVIIWFFFSTKSLTRKDTTASILTGRNAHIEPPLYAPSSSFLPSSHSPPLSSSCFCSNPEDIGTSSPPFQPGDMDLWFHSIRICWWRVLFLMSVFQDYLSSMLDCPPTCSCSQIEIYCNKSDNGRFFPLLALQETGNNGTSIDIAELFKNITTITIMNCNLKTIQPRAFAQNPHLRYIDLSKNPLSTLSWQLFQHLQISELCMSALNSSAQRNSTGFTSLFIVLFPRCVCSRLESVVFECGCDIRWVQLWQQRGDAALHTQQLYCKNGASKIRLHNMYIHNCDLPEISVSHSSLLVMEGDNVTSNVYWPNIHSINLTLFNISREDNNFQLTCIAENVVGMSNSSIQLNVQFPPLIVRLAEPEKRHDTCIEFTVRGYPHPKLRWFYKKKEIVENDYIRTELDFYQDYLEGCLIFKNPTHLNNGNYTLEASNRLGTVTKSVNGRFLVAPDIEVPPSDGEAGRPDEDTFGVSIAVGLAGFACVLLLVLFLLINKYGRRSKFGMKGNCIIVQHPFPQLIFFSKPLFI